MKAKIKNTVAGDLPFLRSLKTTNELTFWTLSTFGIMRPIYYEYLNGVFKKNGIDKSKLTDTDLKTATPLTYNSELEKYEGKENRWKQKKRNIYRKTKMNKAALVLLFALFAIITHAQSPYYLLYVNKDTVQAGDVVKIVATDGNVFQVNCPGTNIAIGFESYINGNLYTILAGTWNQYEVNDSITYNWTIPVGTAVGLGQFYFNGGNANCVLEQTQFNMYVKAGYNSIETYNKDMRVVDTIYYNMIGQQVNTLERGLIYVRVDTFSDGSKSISKAIF